MLTYNTTKKKIFTHYTIYFSIIIATEVAEVFCIIANFITFFQNRHNLKKFPFTFAGADFIIFVAYKTIAAPYEITFIAAPYF